LVIVDDTAAAGTAKMSSIKNRRHPRITLFLMPKLPIYQLIARAWNRYLINFIKLFLWKIPRKKEPIRYGMTSESFQNTINTTALNLTIRVVMQKKSLMEQCREFGPKEWAQVVFMVLIMCAGGYLIIYSVYMMTVNNEPGLFMFSIAMFGVGCTTIWFALSHVEIQTTEEKLESITARLDKIIDRIEKQ
jgi:hypothetical protein